MTDTESGFVATKEHRRFVEFCEAGRRHRYIGLCYGPPGSARTHARWDVLEPFLSRYALGDEPPEGVDGCFTVFYAPEVANTPRSVDRGLGLLLLRLPLYLRFVDALPNVAGDDQCPLVRVSINSVY